MGGLIAILIIMIPALAASDAVDAAHDYAVKRRFQRKMRLRRGCNYTYN